MVLVAFILALDTSPRAVAAKVTDLSALVNTGLGYNVLQLTMLKGRVRGRCRGRTGADCA